jgi:beta-lactamase class D
LKKIYLLGLLLLSQSSLLWANESAELCQEGAKDCTFVLLNGATGEIQQVNTGRAKTRFSPFSTFKIPNSVIGLETGVIASAEQTLTYDKEKYPIQAWWPPVWKLPQYNLASALKYSVVPIYRQLAVDIGKKSMQNHVDKFHYGNQDISSGLDNFWLNGSLKISAIEEVHFLEKLMTNQFSLKAQSLKELKEVMLMKETSEYKLHAKTGAGKVDDGSMLGWYVGFVENAEGVHYFAFNFNRDTYGEMKASRMKIATNHLKQAGVIK